MAEQVIKYQTPDGMLFDSKEEAQHHELYIDNSKTLYSLIEDVMKFDLCYSSIDECELHDWLINNSTIVRKTLEPWDK